MAVRKAQLIHDGVKFINQVYFSSCLDGRSLEAIKGKRRQAIYKAHRFQDDKASPGEYHAGWPLPDVVCASERNQVTGNEMRNTEGRNGLSHTSEGGPGSPTVCKLALPTLVESVVVTGG